MKLVLALLLTSTVALGQPMDDVLVLRNALGSGSQDLPIEGFSNAELTADEGVLQLPSYMPGYPTAATIWPRAVSVQCEQHETRVFCKGYQWRPELGRGEYLFVRPVVAATPTPPAPAPEPIVIYVPYEVSIPAEPPPPLDIEPSGGHTEKLVIIPELPKKKPRKRKVASCTPDGKVHWKEVK